MGAVTVALIGFFAFLMMRVTAPQMVPLFTDLSLQEAGAIVKDLERQAIVYELRYDGPTVLVPKDQVLKVRMMLAESGLPRGGGIGHDVFDEYETHGATSLLRNINNNTALDGELS